MKTKATAQKRTKVTKKTSAPFAPLFPSFPFVKILLALLLAASFSGTLRAVGPQYTITDLGTLGGSYSYGHGINDSGQVTGWAEIADNYTRHAFLYTGGSMIDLGALGGTTSLGHGINNSGQVTGYFSSMGGFTRHAFLYSDGSMIDLSALGSSSNNNDSDSGYGINNSGQVTGINDHQGFLYTGGSMSDLGTLGGGRSAGSSINNSGQVTGWANLKGNSSYHAFLYSDSSMIDLGTLGGNSSAGTGINDFGQVTGYSYVTPGSWVPRAFLYTGGSMIDLGTLGGDSSQGYGINNSGQVTGQSSTTNYGSRAFLYTDDTMYAIADLVGAAPLASNIEISDYGNSINNWGQIAAMGNVGSSYRALLLNPVNPLTIVSDGGATRNTKFVAGMSYDKFAVITDPGNLNTTVSLLDGTAGSGGATAYGLNRDVTVAFTGEDNTGLASDIVSLTGTFSDTIVLSLSYDETLFGDNVALGWFDDGAGEWTLAVHGNTGASSTPTFFEGAYDANLHFHLGYYGVDAANHTTWAVINHNSKFAATQTIPEPGSLALLGLGIGSLLLRRQQRRR